MALKRLLGCGLVPLGIRVRGANDSQISLDVTSRSIVGATELDLSLIRKSDAVGALQGGRHSTLAGLTVHADQFLAVGHCVDV